MWSPRNFFGHNPAMGVIVGITLHKVYKVYEVCIKKFPDDIKYFAVKSQWIWDTNQQL